MNLSQMQYYKQQKGYSLDKLSELSGVPRGTLQKIFSGTTKSPRYETLQALERVLRPDRTTLQEKLGQEASDHVSPEKGVSYQEILNGGSNILARVAESPLAYETRQGSHTLDDYYALPDEQRVELIDGVFYDMSAPTTAHQIVGGEIYVQIRNFIKNKGGACIPLISPVDVQLDCDDKTMVQPDVMILCDRSKLIRRCIFGAPDFVVEVLSASTKRKDATLKLTKYREAGVREYWLIDIDKEKAVVYFFEEDELPVIYGADAEIPVGIFGRELKISMAEVLEGVRGL